MSQESSAEVIGGPRDLGSSENREDEIKRLHELLTLLRCEFSVMDRETSQLLLKLMLERSMRTGKGPISLLEWLNRYAVGRSSVPTPSGEASAMQLSDILLKQLMDFMKEFRETRMSAITNTINSNKE